MLLITVRTVCTAKSISGKIRYLCCLGYIHDIRIFQVIAFNGIIMVIPRRAIHMLACFWISLVESKTSLDFSNSGLTEVPPAPTNTTVTKLNLMQNEIRELQRHSFKDYIDLIEINLANNGLQIIHDGVFDMLSLKKLKLNQNRISKLPVDFGPSTTTLGSLIFNGAIVDHRVLSHAYFGAFTSLGFLDIGGGKVGNMNDSFYPPNIVILAINVGTMDKCPLLSSVTPYIRSVSLDRHRIRSIPDEAVRSLPRLRQFFMRDNKLSNLPNFSNCKSLEKLILTNNELSVIPRQHIEGLDRLKVLQLGENVITIMPDISNLFALGTFGIGNNLISEIPPKYIDGLLNMENFACENNKLLFMPDVKIFFPQLKTLFVQGNRLKTLPDLYAMSSLSTLSAAENPLVCNRSLCWLRMWPWMRPSLTVLQDKPLCDQPASLAHIQVIRFHPTGVECYKGKKPQSVSI